MDFTHDLGAHVCLPWHCTPRDIDWSYIEGYDLPTVCMYTILLYCWMRVTLLLLLFLDASALQAHLLGFWILLSLSVAGVVPCPLHSQLPPAIQAKVSLHEIITYNLSFFTKWLGLPNHHPYALVIEQPYNILANCPRAVEGPCMHPSGL